jgi:hypothetical protein
MRALAAQSPDTHRGDGAIALEVVSSSDSPFESKPCIIHACKEYPGAQLRSARCCSSRFAQEEGSNLRPESRRRLSNGQRGRILGIGGVFFKSANRNQMREWYSKHLES